MGKLTPWEATCGICGKTLHIGMTRKDLARKWARYRGWTYLPDFGWSCGCRHQLVSVQVVPQAPPTQETRHGFLRAQFKLIID